MLGIDNALRDPVHGWIKFTDEEKQIIDSELFQRLRYISQLTSTDSVYPGGCHSRFIHSLGVMAVAGKMMKHLLRSGSVLYDSTKGGDPDISERQWVQIARIAGLLHDIGHGPFSHAFDRIVYSKIYNVQDGGHDHHRLKLIEHPSLKKAIEACGISTYDIECVWTASKPNQDSSLSDVLYYLTKLCVGGPLGADRIDFVLRDSYFTGTKHLGTIAWKRIIYNSTVLHSKGCFVLAYAYKTLHDIIQALDGRRYMYHGVYLNKTVDSASLVIEQMMEALDREPNDLDLVEQVEDISKFALLNDNTVMGIAILGNRDQESGQWCERLMKRRLPKMLKEELVDGKIPFDEASWRREWFGSDSSNNTTTTNIIIRKTRCITGIDPYKFEQYNVKFYKTDSSKNIEILDCETALEDARFKSIRPYYIVRAYEINFDM
jgi:HD superfamily phosphohydrolase